MKRAKGQLRTQAGSAKRRLKSGFWDENHEIEERTKTYNLYYGKTDAEDEQFYQRVAELVMSGINPLPQILDRAYMDGLDEPGRERYVLSIGARVRKCVERYNQVC